MKYLQTTSIKNGYQQIPCLTASQLQHLFDSLLVVVFTINQDGQIEYISNVSSVIWGYRPEELTGTLVQEVVMEEDRVKTTEYLKKMISGHHVPHFENRIVRKDGELVPISWAGRWDAHDQLFYCVVRDITERKSILEQREQYHFEVTNILERITDNFFSVNKNWIITYRNKQTALTTKRSDTEILGRSIWDCYPEFVGTVLYDQFHKAIKEQTPVQFDFFYDRFNIWFEIKAYPSENGLSVLFNNVNERKQWELLHGEYEKKIKEQNTYLTGILERMTEGFLALDKELRVIYWNKQAENILGKSREDLLSRYIWECLSEVVTTPFFTRFEKAHTEGSAECFEIFYPPLNIWFDITIVPSQNGTSVFFKDITQRKRTEEELQRLSLIAKETVNMVVMTDPEIKITWVNPAFTKITGYTLEEALGHSPGSLLYGPESDPDVIQYIREQIEKGESFHVELINYSKSNRKFWVEVNCQPVRDEKGVVQQFFSIQSDITERKMLQHRLNKELRERQQMITSAAIKAQEKERALVGRELHDNVNQVLTTVKLYIELCLGGTANREDILQKSLHLLQTSITEIRNLSKRLSAPSLGNIRLKDSVNDLIATITATNKIFITLETASIADLEVDHELHLAVYRILQEHLTNILKHAGAKKVEVIFDCLDGDLTMKIIDDGKGFNPRKKSSGIGITNMVTRAESLKGSLTINSAPGLGTVLLARFPLDKETPVEGVGIGN